MKMEVSSKLENINFKTKKTQSCIPDICFTSPEKGRKYLCKPPYNPKKSMHGHAIDFYLIWEEFGLIPTVVSDEQKDPTDFIGIYSKFPRYLNENDLYKLRTDKSDSSFIQIVEATSKQTNLKYIIKRRLLVKVVGKKIEIPVLQELDYLKRRSFEEYLYSKLFSLSPYGTEARGYNLIYLPSQKYYCSEFLMDYVEEKTDYMKSMPLNTSEKLEFFIHLVICQLIMEGLNLSHLDLKPSNIICKEQIITERDTTNTSYVIPIVIDFEIGKMLSKTDKKQEINAGNGLTIEFSSPEQYSCEINKADKTYSPWSSQIYSTGLVLCYCAGLTIYPGIEQLIKNYPNREDKNIQTQFLEDFKKLINATPDPTLKKIYRLIRGCLHLEPYKRLTAIELLDKLMKLDRKDYEKFDQDISYLESSHKNIIVGEYGGKPGTLQEGANSILTQKLKNCKVEISSLKASIQKKDEELEILNSKYLELVEKYETALKENKEFQESNQILNNTKSGLQLKCEALEEKNKILEKYHETECHSMSQVIAEKQNLIAEKQNLIAEKQNLIDEKEKVNQLLLGEKSETSKSLPTLFIESIKPLMESFKNSVSMSQSFSQSQIPQEIEAKTYKKIQYEINQNITYFLAAADLTRYPKNFENLACPTDTKTIILNLLGGYKEIAKKLDISNIVLPIPSEKK